jgi:hypothetical protein
MSEQKVYVVPFPFLRCKVSLWDEDGGCEIDGWKPGTEFRGVTEYCDGERFADAIGEMIVTEVSRHKPGRYPERVFFMRRWRNPDGEEFGKSGLQVAVASKFARTIAGYSYPFTLDDRSSVAA